VYLCLAGGGPLWEPMKALAKSLGVEGKILFPGRVSEEDLRRCYEGADLFLLPTRSLECFGLPILEAFAYGLPVISTDAAAIPELMKPVLPDCVAPAGDVIGFREKVRAYLEGRLAIPGSQHLIDYATREYGRDRITARHIQFLES